VLVFARELQWAIEPFLFPTPRHLHCAVKYQNTDPRSVSRLGRPPNNYSLHCIWACGDFFRLHQRKDDFSMWNFISRNLQKPKGLRQPMARAQNIKVNGIFDA
jgi:hypothetical protein